MLPSKCRSEYTSSSLQEEFTHRNDGNGRRFLKFSDQGNVLFCRVVCKSDWRAVFWKQWHGSAHRSGRTDYQSSDSECPVHRTIARVQQIAWNTVDRWLEKAATSCRQFSQRMITRIEIRELQADEICTLVGGKEQSPVWIFAAIEVWSRLWPSTVVGKRSYRNTLTLFRDVCARNHGNNVPLIATDVFKFYRQVVRRLFGAACLYGQVIKKRKKDLVVRVQRKASFGAAWRWDELWRNSEDSRQLNTSYIERLNLTIRQGSAYLCRRSLCHARRKQRLEDHLELLRCNYNFLRSHRALKFGRQVRTPAMQVGLARRRLTFRDIFLSLPRFLRLKVNCIFIRQATSTAQQNFVIFIAA